MRILVARGDAIGDTLLSLPAIHALHRHLPEAEITVISSKAAEVVFRDDPAVARVLHPGDALGRFDQAYAFTEKMWGYDALRTAPVRVGFWPGASKPFKSLMLWPRLTHRAASAERPGEDQGIHEVERYYRLLQAIGVQETPGPIRMVVPEGDRAWGLEWVQSRRLQGFVGLQLSEKWQRGGWPLSVVQSLVKALDAVVLYGPAEAGWAAQVAARAQFYDPSLKRYAAVLSQASLLVTMDTSSVHVAAGEGVPVVDVFPELNFRHNTTRWRPWMVGHEVVQKPEWQPGQEERFTEAVLQAVERVHRTHVDQCRHPHV